MKKIVCILAGVLGVFSPLLGMGIIESIPVESRSYVCNNLYTVLQYISAGYVFVICGGAVIALLFMVWALTMAAREV